ncbi:MAG: universal stress protein [Rhizobiaceae bacterium]|nr:universal stress protein [Rhizobiaceae bacterium]
MTYKSIFVVVQTEEEAPALLEGAVRLAKHFDSHLIGFHSEPVQLSYAAAAGFPDADYIRETTEIGIARTKAIEAAFKARVTDENISAAWGALEAPGPDHAIGDISLAHSVDLILAAQPTAPSGESGEIDSLLYDSGRPLLVLPHDRTCPDGFRRILIGWNGTKQAARAVFDALPLLKAADTVELLVVERSQEDAPIGRTVTDTLKRHGVHVQRVTELAGKRSIEEVLANRIAATGADLLVLGAYSHSWLREFLFGGVTHHILQSCSVATFLSR